MKKPVDEYGNIRCEVCGKIQSPKFKECVFCCEHDTLNFIEEWCGSDETGFWGVGFICADCGKNFDWGIKTIINKYKAVKTLIH